MVQTKFSKEVLEYISNKDFAGYLVVTDIFANNSICKAHRIIKSKTYGLFDYEINLYNIPAICLEFIKENCKVDSRLLELRKGIKPMKNQQYENLPEVYFKTLVKRKSAPRKKHDKEYHNFF